MREIVKQNLSKKERKEEREREIEHAHGRLGKQIASKLLKHKILNDQK